MEKREYIDGTESVEIGPLARLLAELPHHLQGNEIRCVTLYPLTEQRMREEFERQLDALRIKKAPDA